MPFVDACLLHGAGCASEKVSEESEVVTAETAALPRTLHINVIIPLYMIAVRFKK